MLCPEAHRAGTSLHCSLSSLFIQLAPCLAHLFHFRLDSPSPGGLWTTLLLLPSGVHLRDTLVMLFVGFLSTCPIHRQRYLLRVVCMLVELVISCRFSFENLTGQYTCILSILLRQPLWKLESLLMSFSVILQHSAPYNRTGRTTVV